MNPRTLLLCAIALNLTLTIFAGCATAAREQVATAASAPLVNTYWRLAQLGGEVIDNPPGDAAIGLQLQPQNPRVTGFAGCNRMFGGYLLNGEMLRFDQLGATKMACVDADRMRLEQRYFDMLAQAARWHIAGSTLELRDAGGTVLASFAADAAPRE